MKGIYRIDSPNGKVYFGQSINVERRIKQYKKIKKGNAFINRSILKYGYAAHKFSIVCVLPDEVSKAVLTNYEQFFIDQFKEAGHSLLNTLPTAGSPAGYKRSEEQKKKHSIFMTGRPSPKKGIPLSEEQKEKLRAASKKQVNRKGPPKGNVPWNKGKTFPGTGRKTPLSDETKMKISKTLTGKKLSQESIRKRTETIKAKKAAGYIKRTWTDEAKERQRMKYLGIKKK